MRFAVIVLATASPLVRQITPSWLQRCCDAVEVQLNVDVGTAWNVTRFVVEASDGKGLATDTIVFAIVDSLPNDPTAIAYHTTNGTGLPIAFLALDQCQSLDDVSCAISHECVETAIDPDCNRWAAKGLAAIGVAVAQFVALEACDPVESTTYRYGDIVLSDFVLPSYFSGGGLAPFSFAQAQGQIGPPATFTIAPGGYQEVFTYGGKIDTESLERTHPMHRARLAHWSSRSFRRRLAVAAGKR